MKKKLTTFESAMLIAGSGLGTGILAIPYAAAKTGMSGFLASTALAYAASVLLHLAAADLVLHSENSTQLIGIFKEHLFFGSRGRIMSLLFFAVLAVVLLFNLTIYTDVASDVISDMFGITLLQSKIIFYFMSSAIVLSGIKIIGVSEKYSMVLMAAVVFFLSYKSSGYASDRIDFSFGRVPAIAALYGLIMFSFSALFSVPQVANNIENKNKVRVSIIFGIGANTLITIIFTVAALVSPGTVTKIATVGLSETLGMKIKAACSLFVLLAMLTSYWSIALAELDIIREQTKLGRKMCWLAATFPTLLMAIFLPGTYISLIQIVGGAVAVIAALLIIPSYYNAVRDSKDVLILGRIGKSRGLLCLVFILYILMAVSSFIEIN